MHVQVACMRWSTRTTCRAASRASRVLRRGQRRPPTRPPAAPALHRQAPRSQSLRRPCYGSRSTTTPSRRARFSISQWCALQPLTPALPGGQAGHYRSTTPRAPSARRANCRTTNGDRPRSRRRSRPSVSARLASLAWHPSAPACGGAPAQSCSKHHSGVVCLLSGMERRFSGGAAARGQVQAPSGSS